MSDADKGLTLLILFYLVTIGGVGALAFLSATQTF